MEHPRVLILIFALLCTGPAFGESQPESFDEGNDPFGDPTAYEFADDEKADKEFFHLGRFLMFGFDVGGGIYTGGLGRSTDPGAYFGARLIYFFDRSVAFEAAAHYANQTDIITNLSGTGSATLSTDLIPLTLGFRYYFDTRSSPRALSIANPYLAFGGGAYLRKQEQIANGGLTLSPGNSNQFGAYGGVGVEFAVYRKTLYLGVDLRYHLIFFLDEDDNLQGNVNAGDRAGDYFTPVVTFTYNF